MAQIRNRVFEIVETAHPGDRASKAFDLFIVVLILLNVAAMILQTIDSVYSAAKAFFYWFEVVSVLIFTIEYALRIWSCTADRSITSPVLGRVRYALRPLLLIDLFAILPFYLPVVLLDLRSLRAFRLMRLARLAKLGRYSAALQTLGRVLLAKKAELVVSISFMAVLILVSSSLMYYAEHEAQPEKFSSIPAAMWWAIATLTTVGYGDVFPITASGKILASVIAVLGIGMFALPTGILGAAFVDEFGSRNKSYCPHCGKPL